MAAIGAFRDVFGCRFVSVSFIKTFCMEGGVEVKTCSSIISMTNKRLHFGIRRLSSLLFLPERDIVEDFLNSSNEAFNGPFCVENEFENGFRDLVNTTNDS